MQISPIHPPPSLASASRRIFAPCEESNSRRVLISRARVIERANITVRSSSGMSAQPDIPFFVTTLSPSQDDGFLEGLDESPSRLLQPTVRLFNQMHCSLSARRLRRLQRRGGGFFAHAEVQTSACSFRMSGRGCRVPTTARTGTPSGTSVQPDAPISFVRCLSPLRMRDGSILTHSWSS